VFPPAQQWPNPQALACLLRGGEWWAGWFAWHPAANTRSAALITDHTCRYEPQLGHSRVPSYCIIAFQDGYRVNAQSPLGSQLLSPPSSQPLVYLPALSLFKVPCRSYRLGTYQGSYHEFIVYLLVPLVYG
jgi:hypothetical protein